MTNAHVVGASGTVEVHAGKVTLQGEVAFVDDEADLAFLQVPGDALPVLAAVGTRAASIGDKVFAIGAPLGLERSLSEGIVAGLRVRGSTRLIQTTAPISPGSSGGGLFDARANLIGITTFKLRGAENVNFAVDAGLIDETVMAGDVAIQVQAGFKVKLMSPQFVRWLRTEKGPTGEPLYKHLDALIRDGSKTGDYKGTFEKLTEHVANYLWAQRTFQERRAASRPEGAPVQITCAIHMLDSGRFVADLPLSLDEARGSVNRWKAQFSEATIAFEAGNLYFSLDRTTGRLSSGEKGGPLNTAGQCITVQRKF